MLVDLVYVVINDDPTLHTFATVSNMATKLTDKNYLFLRRLILYWYMYLHVFSIHEHESVVNCS